VRGFSRLRSTPCSRRSGCSRPRSICLRFLIAGSIGSTRASRRSILLLLPLSVAVASQVFSVVPIGIPRPSELAQGPPSATSLSLRSLS
jgi:hypothetical protein